MFHGKNVFSVANGSVLEWVLRGVNEECEIPFSLCVQFVSHPEQGVGLMIDHALSDIPGEIQLEFGEEKQDYDLHNGQVVVFPDRGGVYVVHNELGYGLLELKSQHEDDKTVPGEKGVLYFHNHLPTGFHESNGNVHHLGNAANFEVFIPSSED